MSNRVAVVIVASTRAASGVYPDRTGPVIANWLAERGFEVRGPEVVSDGSALAGALHTAVATAPAVILSTGGTGLSPSDGTPEATAPLLDRHLPGLMEEIRRRGGAKTPTALLTRGLAGVAGHTLILNLPGSMGGVLDGLDVLDPVLDHLLVQIAGVDSHESVSSGRPEGPRSVSVPSETQHWPVRKDSTMREETEPALAADDAALLRRAIQIGHDAREAGRHPFGALVTDAGGRIAAERGNNSLPPDGDPTQHAELAAAAAAFRALGPDGMHGSTLYTSAEPCAMCTGAAYWTGISRIVYALSEESLLALTGDDPENPTFSLPCREVIARGQRPIDVVGPVLEDEASVDHIGFWNP